MSIIIKCVRGDGLKEAPSINDALVVSSNDAKARGKRWLDDNYYLVKKHTMQVPHKKSILQGEWITVTDSKLSLQNKLMKVKSYNLSITPNGVWANIEAEYYEEFSVP